MSLIDFTYADQKLSNFGYMPCSFDSSDLSSISFGSNATFTTIRLNSSSKINYFQQNMKMYIRHLSQSKYVRNVLLIIYILLMKNFDY